MEKLKYSYFISKKLPQGVFCFNLQAVLRDFYLTTVILYVYVLELSASWKNVT